MKVEDTSLQGMNNFMLSYPSIYLSDLYDCEKNIYAKQTLLEIRAELKQKISKRLRELNIFEIGEMSKGLKHVFKILARRYPDSSKVETCWLYLQEVAAVRRFWIQIQYDLSN